MSREVIALALRPEPAIFARALSFVMTLPSWFGLLVTEWPLFALLTRHAERSAEWECAEADAALLQQSARQQPWNTLASSKRLKPH